MLITKEYRKWMSNEATKCNRYVIQHTNNPLLFPYLTLHEKKRRQSHSFVTTYTTIINHNPKFVSQRPTSEESGYYASVKNKFFA